MTRRPALKHDDTEQSQRFISAASVIREDYVGPAFDEKLLKVAGAQIVPKKKESA